VYGAAPVPTGGVYSSSSAIDQQQSNMSYQQQRSFGNQPTFDQQHRTQQDIMYVV
jgi:hypothetical protein